MRARNLILAGLLVLLPALPAAAPVLGDTAVGEAVKDLLGIEDDWKLRYADVDIDGAVDVRKTDNVQEVGRLELPGTTDLQFQRRTGEGLILDGEEYTGDHLDIVVAGGMSGPEGDGTGGLYTIDVTDPTNPTMLAGFACGGFHSDVAVYENLAILGHDTRTSAGCEVADARETLTNPVAVEGVQIFDITDPANPVLVRYYSDFLGELPRGPHNLSLNNEAGLVYFSFQALGATPYFGYLDLHDLDAKPVYWPMRDISNEIASGDSCHDIGLAHGFEDALGGTRDLLFCAGVTATYIWDIEDPRQPVPVSKIANPAINIHHGARLAGDGKTLVLNDELAGAAAAFGCQGGAPTGAQWFYDISVPEVPVLIDAVATSELASADAPCTSHFYNFLPYEDGTQRLVTGWYRSGVVVHDFTDHPVHATEVAHFDPEGAVFWGAYAWHGYLYGSSYATDSAVGGLYVLELEGLQDLEPFPADEGTAFGRWTGNLIATPATPLAG